MSVHEVNILNDLANLTFKKNYINSNDLNFTSYQINFT